MKGRGKDAALGPMIGATRGNETLEIPYSELDASGSPHSSEWELNRVFQRAYTFEGAEEA